MAEREFKEKYFKNSNQEISEVDFEKLLLKYTGRDYMHAVSFMTPLGKSLTFNYVARIYHRTTDRPINEERFLELLNVFDEITKHGYFVNDNAGMKFQMNRLKNTPCTYSNFLTQSDDFLFAVVICIAKNVVKTIGIKYDLDNKMYILPFRGEIYEFKTYDQLIIKIIDIYDNESAVECRNSGFKYVY
ncbi:MAG: hypothetical protein QW478_00100 [Candidatus Micrarchaeaceae archaeon]